jgi:hypothetical protein
VLIVTCPCALSLAAPATLVAAAGGLARRGVLLQRLDALEALARTIAGSSSTRPAPDRRPPHGRGVPNAWCRCSRPMRPLPCGPRRRWRAGRSHPLSQGAGRGGSDVPRCRTRAGTTSRRHRAGPAGRDGQARRGAGVGRPGLGSTAGREAPTPKSGWRATAWPVARFAFDEALREGAARRWRAARRWAWVTLLSGDSAGVRRMAGRLGIDDVWWRAQTRRQAGGGGRGPGAAGRRSRWWATASTTRRCWRGRCLAGHGSGALAARTGRCGDRLQPARDMVHARASARRHAHRAPEPCLGGLYNFVLHPAGAGGLAAALGRRPGHGGELAARDPERTTRARDAPAN